MNAVKKASKTKGAIGLQRFLRVRERGRGFGIAESLTLPYVQRIATSPDIPKRVARASDMLLLLDIINKILRPESAAVFDDNVEMRGRKNLE